MSCKKNSKLVPLQIMLQLGCLHLLRVSQTASSQAQLCDLSTALSLQPQCATVEIKELTCSQTLWEQSLSSIERPELHEQTWKSC